MNVFLGIFAAVLLVLVGTYIVEDKYVMPMHRDAVVRCLASNACSFDRLLQLSTQAEPVSCFAQEISFQDPREYHLYAMDGKMRMDLVDPSGRRPALHMIKDIKNPDNTVTWNDNHTPVSEPTREVGIQLRVTCDYWGGDPSYFVPPSFE